MDMLCIMNYPAIYFVPESSRLSFLSGKFCSVYTKWEISIFMKFKMAANATHVGGWLMEKYFTWHNFY